MAANRKSVTTKAGPFAKGGSGKMFGKGFAGPQEAGQSTAGGRGKSDGKFAKGGSGKMFGKSGSTPQKPGISSAR